MLQNIKKRNEGFTIIEVLIVLAIAGLIMLIVFLAVPALQRNSRNTNRRTDVSKAVGALTEAINNNAGKVPTGAAGFVPDAVSTVGYSYYDSTDIIYDGAKATSAPTTIKFDKITIRFGLKCGGTVPASGTPSATGDLTITTTAGTPPVTTNLTTLSGATARSSIALYATEVGGGKYQPVCIES